MNKLKIGIIGAGRLGTVLAGLLVKSGYAVELSHGESNATTERVAGLLGTDVTLVSRAEITENDIIVLAVRWEHVEEALTPLRHNLKGKILVDATNPFINEITLFGSDSEVSSSMIVSALVPTASIVKAFNTLLAEWLETVPEVNGGQRVIFISGDEQSSKNIVSVIIKKIGFACIDLGGMKNGGLLQQGGKPLSLKNLVLLPGNSVKKQKNDYRRC